MSKKKSLEIEIEEKFVDECSKIGVKAEKFKRNHKRGGADRIVFIPGGITMFFEFKRPGGEASPHQIRFLAMMRRMGFVAEVVDNWIYPLSIVKEYKK